MSVWTYMSAHIGPLGAGIAAAAVGVVVLLLAARGVTWIVRRPAATTDQETPRERLPFEDVLTFGVAVVASAVAAQGMWNFFRDSLGIRETALRACMFAVFEASMLVCALRTRRRIKDELPPGIEGLAVWALAGISGVLSATDAKTINGGLARLVFPLVAAFLWERGLAIARAKAGQARRINWRITPERFLIWLGVAEPTAQTTGEVDARRHMTRVALAANRLDTAPAGWRHRLARRRLQRTMRRAVRRTGLADDVTTQDMLMGQLGALCNLDSLAALRPPAPWERPEPAALPAPVRVVMLPPTAYMPRPDDDPDRTPDDDPPVPLEYLTKAGAVRLAVAAISSRDAGDIVAWLSEHGRDDIDRKYVGDVLRRSKAILPRPLTALPPHGAALRQQIRPGPGESASA